MDYVVFCTEQERFGIPADLVAEVLDTVNVRRLAGMPAHVAGVVLHRGRWLPAIDAAVRLGLAGKPQRETALVIKRGGSRFILLADEVSGIRSWHDATDVIKTDVGLVTPIDPESLFQNEFEMTLQEEENMTPATSTTIVVFRMGGEEFGTDIAKVVEVLEYRAPVRMPKMPPFLEGVIYLREAILPVIDLRKRMEMPAGAPTPDTRYLVALIDEERVALLVDAVVEVAHLRGDELSDPPPLFRGVSAEYLQGLGKIKGRVVIVLKLERILTSEERITLLRADYKAEQMDEDAFVTTLDDDFGKPRKKRK
ncbi:MAG TPA: chemotaxis protein CheW [Longimicrobiales bacterium]